MPRQLRLEYTGAIYDHAARNYRVELRFLNMKMTGRLMAILAAMCFFLSCKQQRSGEQFIRQKIPIEIQEGQPVIVEIHSLSGDPNAIGIRCPIEIWTALTNSAKTITAHIKASSKPGTQIGWINNASDGTSFIGYIPNTHYLFYVFGEPGAD